jgi:hypothetical protein
MQIYKYQISPESPTVMLGKSAKILKYGTQADNICLWALVDPNEEADQAHIFTVYATGQKVEHSHGEYCDTVFFHDGAYVFHIFKDDLFPNG